MFIQMMNLNVVHDHRKALDSETRREATIFLGIITYCLKDYRIHLQNRPTDRKLWIWRISLDKSVPSHNLTPASHKIKIIQQNSV